MRKEEESKPIPWEAADPKPPVIHASFLGPFLWWRRLRPLL